ncbi:MAG: hypothetical protein A3H23_09775 [Planctomycetes bacterium RIFCSPLOWO2_12_FULL_40_19]|nr:MAG: hypothetical protein A3H23_09775 [Planctomycetes bacterium RIFCSPLOWO2_12_FULL_40_19]
MKKLFILCLFTLIFSFPSTNGFSDILKDLKNFEKSLSDWVKQTDELSQRLSEMEGERGAREKQIADFNQSMADIGNLITDLNAKVDKVANMASLKGVKDIVNSFEGTLDVFKKRFSEMAKRLEDQEVKTAVIERIYQTSQKPVETLINSIDEQKSVISKLAERLDKQEKLIMSMEEVEELNVRLSKLESEFEEIPKEVSEKTEKTEAGKDVEVSEVSPEKTEVEKKDAAPVVQPKETKASPEKVTETDGSIDIGGGFLINNVKLKPFGSSSHISGDIMNKSDREYGLIGFKVQAFDKDNVMLGGHEFTINGFRKDSTKTFEEVITGVEIEEIAMYAIYPARLQSVSDTGESTIRMIEMEPRVAKAETKKVDTKEAAPKDLKELLDKGKDEVLKELEGFENVGGGFYAGKVSFNSFGSSSAVTGEIRNNSKNDFFNASFVMKIYIKNYGMLTSFDFSVRKIKSSETKVFEEIVTGVNPIDIERYEIALKSYY